MIALRLLGGCLVTLMVTGCNPFSEADAMMSEYVERVARVLDTEAQFSPLEPAGQIPRRRERRLEMPELDMDMLDFLSLYGCRLQYVVGERNSVLGRVMQPLNRLRYEIRFIKAAEDCLPEISRESLQDSLREAIESKTESLPIALWNATWAVEEVESLLSLSKGYFPVDSPGNIVRELAVGLDQLNHTATALLAGELDRPLEFMGEVHQRWQAEHRAGQLINSARLLTTRLDDATALLQRRVEGRPLCIGGKPNNQSDIVRNMFFSVYVEKVQPYMSQVRRARDELIRPLESLAEKQMAVMPAEFVAWYRGHLVVDSPESLWGELDRAMTEHIESWQQLLGQCGLRPGA